MNSRQGSYWLLTIRENDFDPYTPAPEGIHYVKGQQERGSENGFVHWQLFLGTKKMSVRQLKQIYPTAHIELSKSKAAEEYVWKEDTRIPGTQFEKGQKPLKRNSKADWSKVKQLAVSGNLEEIPDDIFVR